MVQLKATLPNKASDLIEAALADLIKCERSPKYTINMEDSWHDPDGGKDNPWYDPADGDKCEVCLGGSVMAQSLGAEHKLKYMPGEFGVRLAKKLHALDDFRSGDVGYGLETFRGVAKCDDWYKFDRAITPYGDSPGEFKREMRKLARDLRADGL